MDDVEYRNAVQEFVNATPVFDSAEIVAKWLSDHDVSYTTEQRFEGLMGDCDYLRCDIWIQDKNIVIEVDGQQHYQSSKNDSVEAFLKKRDYGRRKEKFCLDHGIWLIRIVYDELPYLDRILGPLFEVK